MEARTGSARHTSLLAAMLLAATVSLAGCSMFAKGEPAGATATLQGVQDDYTQAELQTEVTQEALEELNSSPDADLQQAYDTFRKSAATMLETGQRLVTHADETHFSGPSYFVASEKSETACLPARLPKLKGTQPAEIGSYFDAIAADAWEVKRAYRAFQFDLSQIQSYLSTELTPKSIDTMSLIFLKAKVDGDSLNYSLEQVLKALERAKTAQERNAAS